uniref:Uncharacterized protein n=1 Tax=Eptatretus burgeri TaxID=7764 RepID=A0A8C4QU98_EPTBU
MSVPVSHNTSNSWFMGSAFLYKPHQAQPETQYSYELQVQNYIVNFQSKGVFKLTQIPTIHSCTTLEFPSYACKVWVRFMLIGCVLSPFPSPHAAFPSPALTPPSLPLMLPSLPSLLMLPSLSSLLMLPSLSSLLMLPSLSSLLMLPSLSLMLPFLPFSSCRLPFPFPHAAFPSLSIMLSSLPFPSCCLPFPFPSCCLSFPSCCLPFPFPSCCLPFPFPHAVFPFPF